MLGARTLSPSCRACAERSGSFALAPVPMVGALAGWWAHGRAAHALHAALPERRALCRPRALHQ